MYKVTVDGVFAGYSDTAVFVRLHENGCYIPCEETEAEGVCVSSLRVPRRRGEHGTHGRGYCFLAQGGRLIRH